MLKKLTHTLVAATLMLGMGAASVQPANAGGRNTAIGVGAAIVGLGILGAVAHARDRGCYQGPRECGWSNRSCFVNRFGDTVCRGGQYTCWRRTVCD